jgi:hypothetical protein
MHLARQAVAQALLRNRDSLLRPSIGERLHRRGILKAHDADNILGLYRFSLSVSLAVVGV